MRALLHCLLLLWACGSGLVEETVGGLRMVSGTVKVKGSGLVDVSIDVSSNESAALITVLAHDSERTHFATVDNPQGNEVFEAVAEALGARASTNAGYLSPVATLNWPRNAGDTLDAGTWTFGIGNVSANDIYSKGKVEFAALLKEDADLTSGTLKVALVWAGGTEQDPDTVVAVEEAVEIWRDMYAAIGIELDVAQTTWPNGDLMSPVMASEPDFESIALETGPHVVNVVLAPDIDDIEDVLGVAGDIPGPLTATTRSAVLVNLLLSAGMNGRFEDLEIRILAETMAHETGHFIGLYHPVESTWDRWDALDDTPECSGENACQNKFAEFLMFPYPVCGMMGCTAQTVITEDQGAAMNGYVGVD
jgi:hypothetical protein